MAVVHCISLSRLCKPCRTATPLSRISHTRLVSIACSPLCRGSNALKLSAPKRSSAVSAVVSEENAVGSCYSGTNMFKLTYLEGNSWLWEVDGLKLLVDPILVVILDFGISWLYDAAKKVLKNFQLSDLPEIDCLLITRSLDDHCHLKTLKPLSEKSPNLKVVAAFNEYKSY